jgi:hypothetical protein
MAENILTDVPNAKTIKAVNHRLEQLTLDLIAINELAHNSNLPSSHGHIQTLLQSMTRACAKDIDSCMVKLGGSKTGYIDAHFGEI